MTPKLVDRPPFHVVGLRKRYDKSGPRDIPQLWERFVARTREVKHVITDAHYGVCEEDASAATPGFFYTACTAVTRLEDVPEGMAGFTVPGGTYAVFTHRGPISRFMETITKIWTEWLPASGLKPTGGMDFELYDERFAMEDDDSEVDVCIPVELPASRVAT